MTELTFPSGFLWGTATAAHQVEGDNSNSDWWEWELKTYRFSVEWARIEPSEGGFDEPALEHYRRMVEAVRKSGLIPMVTLNHFSLPIWVAAKGGWLSEATPALFERYARRVVEASSFRATAEASSGVLATSPLGTGTPYFARISFA